MNDPIHSILNAIGHRPWPLPAKPWFWYQEWNDVIFLHYQVDPNILRSLVPRHLELDQIDGNHCISVVAFTMHNVHPRFTIPIQFLSTFHEVNLRTYVKKDGKPGVYFLSIEAEKWIPTQIARIASGLPYRHSKIQRTKNSYKMDGNRCRIEMNFQVIRPIQLPNEKELWLTERYSLYRGTKVQERALDVHHKPWELFQIEIQKINIGYTAFGALTNFLKPDLTHYSPGVQVLAWL
ncbi:DUF2071 domain-containing protein [Leptospira yanagawae]|uniref:DUF2071 domain-containing protein n=1 Tax=Leptospira yanagawae TaxID=293069 RepID=A0ABY2M852_9LEPT|nr:DUF2071 domain-containing protein [Leptospira yanagawae]TGL25966.1 DUF2071 domain-containing protein [Leptospira yanagawae]